jgi:hypothetical protein
MVDSRITKKCPEKEDKVTKETVVVLNKNLHVNGGQTVGQVIHVLIFTKEKTANSSQIAVKETTVNLITSKRLVCMDQIAIGHSV